MEFTEKIQIQPKSLREFGNIIFFQSIYEGKELIFQDIILVVTW